MKIFLKQIIASMLVATSIVGFVLPSKSTSATIGNKQVEITNQTIQEVESLDIMSYEFKQIKNRSYEIQDEIEKEVMSLGYDNVEEYNDEIGDNIPLEESLYYNNYEYYNTPLPETLEYIENNQERWIGKLVRWGKKLFKSQWFKEKLEDFTKFCAGTLTGLVVEDTYEIAKNGVAKISTRSSSDVVGYGSLESGSEVKLAQHLLNEHGYNLVIDGYWGPKSEAATKAFQRSIGLSADGIIGKHTWAYLIEHL